MADFETQKNIKYDFKYILNKVYGFSIIFQINLY